MRTMFVTFSAVLPQRVYKWNPAVAVECVISG